MTEIKSNSEKNAGKLIAILAAVLLVIVFLCIGIFYMVNSFGSQLIAAQAETQEAGATIMEAYNELQSIAATGTAESYKQILEIPSDWYTLVSDGFAGNRYRWPELIAENESDIAVTHPYFQGNTYHFDALAKTGFVWRLTPKVTSVQDFYCEVDGRMVEGPLDGEFGIVFRESGDNFYIFMVDAEGSYSVFLQYEDDWIDVKVGTWNNSVPEVSQDGTYTTPTLHLAVLAQGTRFYFFINGRFITTIIDESLSRGNVGLSVALNDTGDQGSFEFDNFLLKIP